MIRLAILCWAILIIAILTSYGAFAAPYAVTVTICATPAHTDCETVTVHTIPRPGDSEPWCDGSGPINAAVALTMGFLPRRQSFLMPGSIECRPA